MVKTGRVANLRRELEKFLQGIGNVKAVIEAGRSSYTMVSVLDNMGIEIAIAHPKDIKAIAKAKIKTDERDSYKLAHLLRKGYIPEVYKRSRENRSSQRVLRQRAFYVGKQTSVKNRLRALLAQQGEEIRWLRWAAVEAGWPAIRADFDIRLYNERMKRRKGANSAKVATARRLLTIISRMLKESRPYIPYER